jgi:hypothetical protein
MNTKDKIKAAKKAEKELGIKIIVKSVTPPIVGYESLLKEFTEDLRFKPAFGIGGAFFNSNLKPVLSDLLEILNKNKSALDEIEDATIKFLTAAIMENPPVYIARTRDKKTDIEYFIAKTFIPLKGGKKKEVKVYLGKASEYENDTMHNMARVNGKRLLIKALKEKIE